MYKVAAMVVVLAIPLLFDEGLGNKDVATWILFGVFLAVAFLMCVLDELRQLKQR